LEPGQMASPGAAFATVSEKARQDCQEGQQVVASSVMRMNTLLPGQRAGYSGGAGGPDFAALEIQAVYFSGPSVRQPFNHFMRRRVVPEGSARRPDWRSSAQKRLMPQLALKIPIFRRWGKKFFVAVDSQFFGSLPRIKAVSGFANSEVTWLVYPFTKAGHRYEMGDPTKHFSTWDDVLTALREGVAPNPEEILQELLQKKQKLNLPIHTT